MELRGSNLHAQTNGVAQTGHFTMKATGKAFKILSDGLYSDKPRAVVREICCNAWDAHIAAGKQDVPFEVCLPTTLSPLFYVKDFGIGLSHDDMMHLFTTFFDSTKTESNDFVGALGLGCKSPFSYVDQFNVTSRFDGKIRYYTAFIGDKGLPSIALMSEGHTNECNGLEVSMPIKSGDVSAFITAAQKVLPHFDTEPVVKGCSDLTLTQAVLLRGKDWVLLDRAIPNNSWSRPEVLCARMGAVVYPITSTGITEPGLQDMVHYPFIVDFPLGTLDVAASRESLSYDPHTINAINTRLGVVKQAVGAILTKDMGQAETLWEAHLLYTKTIEDNGLKSLLPAPHSINWSPPAKVVAYDRRYTVHTIDLEGIKLEIVDHDTTDVRTSYRLPFNPRHLSQSRRIKPKDNARIYCVDEKTGWGAKITFAELQRTNALPHGSLIGAGTPDREQIVVITGDYADVLKQLGDPPHTMTSTLDSDPSIITQTVGPDGAKVKVKLSKVWEAPIGSGYFVEPKDKPNLDEVKLVTCMWRGSPTKDGTQAGIMQKYQFASMTTLAKECGLIDDDVIMGIPASHRNLVKKTAWLDVFQHIEQALEAEVKKQRKRIWRWRLIQSGVMSSSLRIDLLPAIIERGVDITEVNRLNAARLSMNTIDKPERKRLAALVRLCRVLGKDELLGFDSMYGQAAAFPMLTRKKARLLDMFPLLKWAGYQENNPDLVEYVCAIDASHHIHASEVSEDNRDYGHSLLDRVNEDDIPF